MRTLAYTVLGGVGGEFPKQGTIADFLFDVPYLFSARLIPPLRVLNDLLARGSDDAGMSGGCTWEPFQISESEWTELKATLVGRKSDGELEFVEPPEWVRGFDDWQAWVMIHRYGFPESYRELDREYRELERAKRQALRDGDEELVLALHLRVLEAGDRLAEVANRHVGNRER